MKDTIRSLVAGTAGAVVTIAVVVAQPALADQADKASAQITSAMIKNGTIRQIDLNRHLRTSVARANTALQAIPDNAVTTPKLGDGAVTGAKIADGSLTAADIAQATGTISVNYPSLGPGACASSPAIETGRLVRGGILLVSAPATVVGAVQVVAREVAGSATAIDIVACNGGGTFDPPSADFTWAVIAP